MFTATDLACSRGERRLFDGLSFTLQRGDWLHVKGENGAGKTTLLRTLIGLSPPDEGEIRWRGADTHERADEYRRAKRNPGADRYTHIRTKPDAGRHRHGGRAGHRLCRGCAGRTGRDPRRFTSGLQERSPAVGTGERVCNPALGAGRGGAAGR